MDTFHDCQRCHGPYRWLPLQSVEVCRDCGHVRRIHQTSTKP
jgi:rRNA maturation endonuclease Nob1